MFAASALKLVHNYKLIGGENLKLLLIGNVVSFIVALLAIRFFITFLTRYGFRLFGYYRIIIGLTLILLLVFGRNLTVL